MKFSVYIGKALYSADGFVHPTVQTPIYSCTPAIRRQCTRCRYRSAPGHIFRGKSMDIVCFGILDGKTYHLVTGNIHFVCIRCRWRGRNTFHLSYVSTCPRASSYPYVQEVSGRRS